MTRTRKKTKRYGLDSDSDSSTDMNVGLADNGEYTVEKVLATKKARNKRYYLIKWDGWSSRYNSWEPIEHLERSQEAIDEYWAAVGFKQNNQTKKSSQRKDKTKERKSVSWSSRGESRIKRRVTSTRPTSSSQQSKSSNLLPDSSGSSSDDDDEEILTAVLKNIKVSNVISPSQIPEKIHGTTLKFDSPVYVVEWKGCPFRFDLVYVEAFSQAFPDFSFNYQLNLT